MKKDKIYIVIAATVVIVAIIIIILVNNSRKLVNQTNNNAINANEASQMTDDELINKTISGEESLNMDNLSEDILLNDIDNVVNEKDPLLEMPGE